jgi:hypothetical protein
VAHLRPKGVASNASRPALSTPAYSFARRVPEIGLPKQPPLPPQPDFDSSGSWSDGAPAPLAAWPHFDPSAGRRFWPTHRTRSARPHDSRLLHPNSDLQPAAARTASPAEPDLGPCTLHRSLRSGALTRRHRSRPLLPCRRGLTWPPAHTSSSRGSWTQMRDPRHQVPGTAVAPGRPRALNCLRPTATTSHFSVLGKHCDESAHRGLHPHRPRGRRNPGNRHRSVSTLNAQSGGAVEVRCLSSGGLR